MAWARAPPRLRFTRGGSLRLLMGFPAELSDDRRFIFTTRTRGGDQCTTGAFSLSTWEWTHIFREGQVIASVPKARAVSGACTCACQRGTGCSDTTRTKRQGTTASRVTGQPTVATSRNKPRARPQDKTARGSGTRARAAPMRHRLATQMDSKGKGTRHRARRRGSRCLF